MKNNSENTNAFLIHISAFAGYLFPFGSIITPLILWQTLKDKSQFLDRNGKEAINFNISFGLYIFILSASIIPFLFGSLFNIFNNLGHIDFGINDGNNFLGVFSFISLVSIISIIKVALIILASIKANNGEDYEYPFTIKFIK